MQLTSQCDKASLTVAKLSSCKRSLRDHRDDASFRVGAPFNGEASKRDNAALGNATGCIVGGKKKKREAR